MSEELRLRSYKLYNLYLEKYGSNYKKLEWIGNEIIDITEDLVVKYKIGELSYEKCCENLDNFLASFNKTNNLIIIYKGYECDNVDFPKSINKLREYAINMYNFYVNFKNLPKDRNSKIYRSFDIWLNYIILNADINSKVYDIDNQCYILIEEIFKYI